MFGSSNWNQIIWKLMSLVQIPSAHMQSEKALSRFLKNPAEAQSLRGSRYFGSWTRTLVATLKNTVFQEIPLSILHFSWTGERRVHKSSPYKSRTYESSLGTLSY